MWMMKKIQESEAGWEPELTSSKDKDSAEELFENARGLEGRKSQTLRARKNKNDKIVDKRVKSSAMKYMTIENIGGCGKKAGNFV